MTRAEMIEQAKQVFRRNDKGTYTVPTHGLYPFQWNWDSVLSALGFAHFDEERAWVEIETLFEHQWEDGMVPHIIFHEHDEGYFPGPDVYRTHRPIPTSGFTQPAVPGFAVRRMVAMARDKALAEKRARYLLPKIHAWHEWFFRTRDPEGTGLVAIIHPWESGRDNSIDWDAALDRVNPEGVGAFQRRDITHANPAHRPTHAQYERYIKLVQTFRDLNWDTSQLHDASPFQVVDPGFNAILFRSCGDLAELAERFGETEMARQSRAFATKGIAALESLWSESHNQYLCYDRKAGKLVQSLSVGGLIPAFAAIPAQRMAGISARIEELGRSCEYLIPSHDPTDPQYDGLRYWRGPSWLIINYMIVDGLTRAGQTRMVDRIMRDSLRLIETSGFAEYYDPITAEPCGGGHFTWTAAMVLEILSQEEALA
ncbi:MAG: trehalase family glycosidase [Pseudomonadota bacterium]